MKANEFTPPTKLHLHFPDTETSVLLDVVSESLRECSEPGMHGPCVCVCMCVCIQTQPGFPKDLPGYFSLWHNTKIDNGR